MATKRAKKSSRTAAKPTAKTKTKAGTKAKTKAKAKSTATAKPKPTAKAKASAPLKRPPARPTGTPLDRARQICLGLPETTEVEAWGAPTFRVKGKIFAWYVAPGGHHGSRPALWILSVSMEQDLMLRVRPDRYFKPPYVGPSGWIGAYVDKSPPWQEIEELVRDGWRRRAPKKLAGLIGS